MKLFIVAILWIVTIWRLPSARQEPWKRALWAAFASLTAALTLSLPQVAEHVDGRTGIVALSTLLKHIAGIIACASVLEWVLALTRPGSFGSRWRRYAVADVAMVAMLVLFTFIQRKPGDFTDVMAGDPTATAYLLVFESYLGLTMATATIMFFIAARRAASGLLRCGLWVLTAGTATGVTYVLLRSAFLIDSISGQPAGSHDLYSASEVLQMVAVALILIGSSMPAVSVALLGRRDYADLNALRPLWLELTSGAPQIVLGDPPSRRTDLTGIADVRLRLLRRTVEIRDALLLLRGYVPDGDLDWARTALADQGLTGEHLEAAVEAVWLRTAITARDSGLPRQKTSTKHTTGGHDLSSEVRWLRLIASAGRTEQVLAVAADLTEHLAATRP